MAKCHSSDMVESPVGELLGVSDYTRGASLLLTCVDVVYSSRPTHWSACSHSSHIFDFQSAKSAGVLCWNLHPSPRVQVPSR